MRFFILQYTGKPIGESGESCKSKYNFSYACKTCGTGARLEGRLHAKGIKKVNKDFFQTLDGDNIISENLYKDLIKKKINVGTLENLIDYRNRKLQFLNLHTELYFPKAVKNKGLIVENQCPDCNKNGFFNDIIVGDIEKKIATKISPLELTYINVSEGFLNQSDIFNTWEHMGLSNLKADGKFVVRFARPLLIVSEKFKALFENKKIKEIRFLEIKIR